MQIHTWQEKLTLQNCCNVSYFISYNLDVNHVFNNTTNQLTFSIFPSLVLDLSSIQAVSTRHSCGGWFNLEPNFPQLPCILSLT